jgi:hypothetical protein
MGTRDKLGRLQKALRGALEAIEQADGTTFHFHPQEACKATFLYFSASLEADHGREPRPEPPGVLKAVAKATDRREALSRVMGGSSFLLPVAREAHRRTRQVRPPLAGGRPRVRGRTRA